MDRFTLPKLCVLAAGAAIGHIGPRYGVLDRRIGGILAVGAGWLVLAAVFSSAPLPQLIGRWPRYEGLVALPVYIGVLSAGARLLGPQAPAGNRRTAVNAGAASAVVIGIVSVAETFGLRPLGGDSARPGALLGNASDQGLVAVMLMALLALPALRERRLRYIFGFAAAAATVVVSGSRGALIGGVVVLLIFGWHLFRQTPRWSSAAALATAPVVLVLASFALPATRARVLTTDNLAAATVPGRWLLWTDSLRLSGEHLLFGLGPSGFVDAIADAHSLEWQQNVGPLNPPDSPHSWPLQALASGGIPLLVLALALAAIGLHVGIRHLRRPSQPPETLSDIALFAACSGAAIGLLTHFSTAGIMGVLALSAGALFSRPARSESSTPRAIGLALGPGTAVVMSISALLVGMGVAGERPLRLAVEASYGANPAAAQDYFTIAAALRFWDPDADLIAARTMAAAGDAAANRGLPTVANEFGVHAELWARQTLADTPDSVEAGFALAVALIDQNDLDGGRLVLDGLLTRAPQDPRLLLRRGVTLATIGDLAGAENDFVAATAAAPSDPLPWRNLAYVYSQQGRAAEAEQAQQRFETLND